MPPLSQPWSPAPDPTTQLPDPPVPEAVPDDPTVGPVPEPSHWPPVVDTVLRYAPIGTRSTWDRLSRRVRAYSGAHPEAWKAEQLRHHVGQLRARGPEAWAEHDDALADLEALETEHRWHLRGRKAQVAVVVLVLAVLVLVVLWHLLGDHGMWPLFWGSLWATCWYTAKGRVLSHRRARSPLCAGPRPECATAVPGRPCPTPDPDCPAAVPPRVVRPRRLDGTEDLTQPIFGGPWDGTEGQDRATVPVRPTPGPCPLTQDRVERALKAAKPKLKQIERERAKGDDADEPVVQVLGSKHMGNGWAVTIGMPEEISAADMADARSGIANAFSTLQRGVPESCVILLPDPTNPRLLTLWICDTPPLEGPPVRTALWHAERVNVHEGILFGRTIEGDSVTVSPLSHWLIAGGTGSGKSESGGLLPLGCSLDPDVQQILMDPEGLGAWAAYSEVAEVIHGTGPAKLAEMADKLEWVVEHEFPRRERAIAEYLKRGSMVMAKPKVTPRMAQDPTAGLPWMVISIDEAQALYRATDGDVAQRAEEAAVQIITRGRKYGIFLHQTTQKPTADNIPTSISAIANTRLLFSVERTEMADAAMPGWRKLGMDPLALLPDDGRGGGNPGAGYLKGIGLVSPHRKWVLLRAECADLGEVREIVKRARTMRLDVRPELLPSAPSASNAPATAQTGAARDDLEPLRRVVAILAEHGGWVRASVVIGELATQHPAEHGTLTTLADLNDLLGEYQLRTRQHPAPDGSRPHHLHYPTCAARLRTLEHPSEQP